MKPMTIEEAILQMDLLGHEFFFFLNAETGDAAVRLPPRPTATSASSKASADGP